MKRQGNTILITGGGSGIGLGLATRFAKQNKVIICGRDKAKLEAAVKDTPGMEFIVCDVAKAEERERLKALTLDKFPALNVLVNNAGIQRRKDGLESDEWAETQSELAINLEAPIHLTRLFADHLSQVPDAALINVTSGLAFSPIAAMPVYCATKAALHSFTLSLRHSFAKRNVEVIEIIPPAVNTDLGGKGLHDFGVPLNDFCDAMFDGLDAGQQEIAYGTAQTRSQASRTELDHYFSQMNT